MLGRWVREPPAAGALSRSLVVKKRNFKPQRRALAARRSQATQGRPKLACRPRWRSVSPEHRLTEALQRPQWIACGFHLRDFRLPAPELIDHAIIHHEQEHVETPAGSDGFATEVEKVEPEIAHPLAVDMALVDLKTTTGGLRLHAVADAGIEGQVIARGRQQPPHDIGVVQDGDIGRGQRVDALLMQLGGCGAVRRNPFIRGMRLGEVAPGLAGLRLAARQQCGATAERSGQAQTRYRGQEASPERIPCGTAGIGTRHLLSVERRDARP